MEEKIRDNASMLEPLGDGKAVFLSDMNDDEVAMWEEDQVHGWAKFKNKIMNL